MCKVIRLTELFASDCNAPFKVAVVLPIKAHITLSV